MLPCAQPEYSLSKPRVTNLMAGLWFGKTRLETAGIYSRETECDPHQTGHTPYKGLAERYQFGISAGIIVTIDGKNHSSVSPRT